MRETVDGADVVQEAMQIAMQLPGHVQGILIIIPDIAVERVVTPGDHVMYTACKHVQGEKQQ